MCKKGVNIPLAVKAMTAPCTRSLPVCAVKSLSSPTPPPAPQSHCSLSSSVIPWIRSSSRTLSMCPGSGYPWPVRLEPNSVLWWISFQMSVSDSPVVLDVPTEKTSLRSQATRSSRSTWKGVPQNFTLCTPAPLPKTSTQYCTPAQNKHPCQNSSIPFLDIDPNSVCMSPLVSPLVFALIIT